jgi:hypothetical protein
MEAPLVADVHEKTGQFRGFPANAAHPGMNGSLVAAIDRLRDRINYREIRFLIARQYGRVPVLRRRLACYVESVQALDICARVRAEEDLREVLTLSEHERAFYLRHGYAHELAPSGDRIEIRSREQVCELTDCDILARTRVVLHRPSERIVLLGQAALNRNNIRPVIYRRTITVPGLAISLLPHGHYFHFFFDLLKPLLRILRRWPELGRATLLMSDAPAPHQQAGVEILRQAYPELKLVRVAPDSRVRCERLLSFHYSADRLIDYTVDGETLRGMRDMFHAWAGVGDTEPTRRLFISRARQKHRRITNESALLEALAPYGFERIFPETLSFRDQVRLFASARVIMGTPGAALTNLLFCRPDAMVIELCSREHPQPLFVGLSRQMGLDHRLVAGGGRGIYGAYSVDLEEILKLVAESREG